MTVKEQAGSAVRWLGMDRAIAYTVFARCWSVLSGPVTLLVLARFLSREEQGFYYTFNSVLGLQIFFELGLGWVIVQFAAHESARLHWDENGLLQGDATAKERLASLLTLSFRWYAGMAVLFVVLLLPGGWWFFARNTQNASVLWHLPWLWVVIAATGSLLLSPLLTILEGCGLVAEIALMTLCQGVVGAFCLWFSFWRGWGLFGGPLCTSASILVALLWLWTRRRHFLLDLHRAAPVVPTLSWRNEVWPLQWKFAVSWLCNYFIFQLFNPVLFAFYGPVEAGRMGMSLSVIGAIASTSISWVTTKAVPFGGLVARREWRELDGLFFPALWRSLALMLLGSGTFFLILLYLRSIAHPLSLRLLDPLPIALLILAGTAQHIVGAQAVYLRAHKREPFFWLSIITAALAGPTTFLVGRAFGATGMMAVYFAISFGLSLGAGTWIFMRKRHEWHDEEQPLVPLQDAVEHEVFAT